MSTLKKSLALLAGAALVLTALTGCGGATSSQGKLKPGFGRTTTTSQILGTHRALSH